MRREVLSWLVWGTLVLGCGGNRDDDGTNTDPVGTGRDPMPTRPGAPTSSTPDTRPALSSDGGSDSSVPFDGGPIGIDAARPKFAEPVPSAAATICVPGPLAPPSATVCALPDSLEPSSYAAPIVLTLEPTCGYVAGTIAAKDEDAYRVMVAKADPVLVELSYTANDRENLELDIDDKGGSIYTFGREPRTAPSELESTILYPKPGQPYDIRVQGSDLNGCQAYALRVDAHHCTDDFEDNDTDATASPLVLDSALKVELHATAHEKDLDFYELTTPKADPFLLRGSYTVGANETLAIRRIVTGPTGMSLVDAIANRTSATESFVHWVDSNAAGAKFHTEIWPSGSGCAPYTLTFDAAACTDTFEDNDSPTTAKVLPIGADTTATVISVDADHYDISALSNGGTCTISYTIADGVPQKLRVNVFSVTGDGVTNGLGGDGTGATKTMKLSWGARGTSRIQIEADVAGNCQPYTIRCDPTVTN
jgi:hypothetical protein